MTAASLHEASIDAQMQALLEAAVDGIISIDEYGIVQTINRAAEQLFGYPAAELVGRNVSHLMPSPYREEHDAYLNRYLRTGERRIIGIGREVLGQRRDGSTFPMELSVAEARVGEKRIFMGIVRDISQRRKAEEEIQASHQDLAKAVAELRSKNEEVRAMTQQLWQAAKLASVGELAASIAHELNNPLATISLRLESILRKTRPLPMIRGDEPPLHDRPEDIPAIVAHLLTCRQIGSYCYSVDEDAMRAMVNYDWPGNVRELANVLERAQILAENNTITLDDLPETLHLPHAAMHARRPAAVSVADPLNLSELERRTVRMALDQEKGNKAQAAKRLGTSRSTLYRLIKKHGLEPP